FMSVTFVAAEPPLTSSTAEHEDQCDTPLLRENPGPSTPEESNFSLNAELPGPSQTKFACQECGKTFYRREHLIVHVRTHSGEKPYHCDICGKAFSQSQNLTIHKRSHSGERPYHCGMCGKLFNTSSHLKTHMRYHSGEKPYPCDICGKRFRQSGQMTRHRTTHTGERPYACHVCGMRYRFPETHMINELPPVSSDDSAAQSENSDSDEEWVHSKGAEALQRQNGSKEQKGQAALPDGDSSAKSPKDRSVCPVCGKGFQYIRPFMKHLKTHNRTSESTKELLSHLQSAHSKRLVCEVCGKTFTNPGCLHIHSKIHTGIKDFKSVEQLPSISNIRLAKFDAFGFYLKLH
uniref:Zinc finger protein 32-like n=1 Tax=Seriola dumerili TaxID=41447 RepID=A0A3B4TYP7_SERDU